MGTEKLSIITINLNNRDGLQKTIDSVVSQTYRDFEWIIIDGGSTDGSKDVIERYSEHIDYWVSEPDRGIYNAMNKGIRLSHGEYLHFLNSGDSFFDKNVLSNVIPLLAGKDYYVGDEMRNGCLMEQNISTSQQICDTMIKKWIPHQTVFTNRRIYDTYGMYREDKKIVSDWWLFFKSIIIGDATVEKLPFTVDIFDTNGISSNCQLDNILAERQDFLSELPRTRFLMDFYIYNYDILHALKSNKIVFFIFRIYFWFYRKYLKI